MNNLSTSDIIAIFSTIFAAAAALFGAFQAFGSVYPIITERRNKWYLERQLSKEYFDPQAISFATKGYVQPKCQNLDPAQEQELRDALTATREYLFQKVDFFLDQDTSRRHLLILADSGIGKTTFMLNYYAYNAKRKKRHTMALIPLSISGTERFISQIKNQEHIVLLLDALDEDVKAIKDYQSRMMELMEICKNFKKVIITCRAQFFPKDDEIPVNTGSIRFGPRRAGEKGVYEFWRLYLSPFSDADIHEYIKKHYSFWRYGTKSFRLRKAALLIAKSVPMLSVRPMLLAHIPDLVEQSKDITSRLNNSKDDIHNISLLYEIMIEAWIEREQFWVNKTALRDFSEKVAVEMISNRSIRGMERIPYQELDVLAEHWGIKLQQWQISGRSLLNRDSNGNYKFSHRSIMEYLFIEQLLKGNQKCLGVELTDQMVKFLLSKLPSISALNSIDRTIIAYFNQIEHGNNQMERNNIMNLFIKQIMLLFKDKCR